MTYLEVESITSLLEAHPDVCDLPTFTFYPQDKVPRTVEHGLDLGIWFGIVDLSEELTRGAVLSSSAHDLRKSEILGPPEGCPIRAFNGYLAALTSNRISHREPTSITRNLPFQINCSTFQSAAL